MDEQNTNALKMQKNHRERIDHYYKCFRLSGEFRRRLADIPAAETYIGAAIAAGKIVFNLETPYCIAETALKFLSIIHETARAAAARGRKIDRPARAAEEQRIRNIHAGALREFWRRTYNRSLDAAEKGNYDSARSFAASAAEIWKAAERVKSNAD